MAQQEDAVISPQTLYLRSVHSDACFMFGGDSNNDNDQEQVLPVHRCFLGMRSEVFKAMFYGKLSEKGPAVYIQDINVNTMKEVLRYMYCNNAILTKENVMECWYASTKYSLHDFNRKCVDFLTEAICPENVCTIFEHAKFFNSRPLMKLCWSFMKRHWKSVIVHEDFLFLSKTTVLPFLNTIISLQEKEIVIAALRWTEDKNGHERLDILWYIRRKRRELENLLASL